MIIVLGAQFSYSMTPRFMGVECCRAKKNRVLLACCVHCDDPVSSYACRNSQARAKYTIFCLLFAALHTSSLLRDEGLRFLDQALAATHRTHRDPRAPDEVARAARSTCAFSFMRRNLFLFPFSSHLGGVWRISSSTRAWSSERRRVVLNFSALFQDHRRSFSKETMHAEHHRSSKRK